MLIREDGGKHPMEKILLHNCFELDVNNCAAKVHIFLKKENIFVNFNVFILKFDYFINV